MKINGIIIVGPIRGLRIETAILRRKGWILMINRARIDKIAEFISFLMFLILLFMLGCVFTFIWMGWSILLLKIFFTSLLTEVMLGIIFQILETKDEYYRY